MSIGKILYGPINRIAGGEGIKKLKAPELAAAAVLISNISTTSKDMVSTYYYTTQSLKNEKIPEEKRKFVAMLDLANGIMNATFGLALGFFVPWVAGKVYDGRFKSRFKNVESLQNEVKKLGKKVGSEKIKGLNIDELSVDAVEAFIRQRGKYTKAGIGVLAALVGSQILGKRIITPLIATPMASAFKNKMEQKTGEKNTPELDRIIDTRLPQMLSMNNFKQSLNAVPQAGAVSQQVPSTSQVRS